MYEKKKKTNWLSDRKITRPKTLSFFSVFIFLFRNWIPGHFVDLRRRDEELRRAFFIANSVIFFT